MPGISNVSNVDGWYHEGYYGAEEESCTCLKPVESLGKCWSQCVINSSVAVIVLIFSYFTPSGFRKENGLINHNSHKEIPTMAIFIDHYNAC